MRITLVGGNPNASRDFAFCNAISTPKVLCASEFVELLAEILGQALMACIGLFFIHRVITAVPTFSGTAMGDINLFSIMYNAYT